MSLAWHVLVPVFAIAAMLGSWRRPVLLALIAWAASAGSLCLAAYRVASPALGPYPVGNWAPPYGIALRADGLSTLMLLLTGVLFLAASTYHLGETLSRAQATRNPVYHLTFPLLLLSLNGIFLTADFFNFYVFFELLAVASYLLVSLGKHAPLEAAWKYSAQSVLGSICLLIGTVLLYGETGALGMAEVAARHAGPLVLVAPFFLAAFLLKGAIFPFHFWQPDAHAAATTPGSMLLAGLLIKVGLYGLIRFWSLLMGHAPAGVLLLLGTASIAFGAVAAWRQGDAKRMLGFSSVSQVGFVLLGLGLGTAGALGAALFYLVSHSLTKALLFAGAGLLGDRLGTTRLEALRGAGRGDPFLAAACFIGFASLVGFPPTAGFVAKLGLLGASLAAGAWPWAVVVVVGGFLTLAYAGRLFVILFWEAPSAPPAARLPAPLGLAVAAGLAASVLLCLVAARPLHAFCQASAAQLFGPAAAVSDRRGP